MDNQQWLDVFKTIGRKMRAGIAEFLSREGGKVALGKGAGGDRTFPVDKWAEDIIIAELEQAHRQRSGAVRLPLLGGGAGARPATLQPRLGAQP